jgi:hypothetical protein
VCSPSSRSAPLLYLAPLMLHPAFAKSQAARLSEYWARQYEEFFVRKTLTRRSRLAKAAGEAEAAAAESGTTSVRSAAGGTTSMRPALRSTDAAAAMAPSAGRVLQQMFGGMFGKRCRLLTQPYCCRHALATSHCVLCGNRRKYACGSAQKQPMQLRRQALVVCHKCGYALALVLLLDTILGLAACPADPYRCHAAYEQRLLTTCMPHHACLLLATPHHPTSKLNITGENITGCHHVLLQGWHRGRAVGAAALGTSRAADSGRRRGVQPTPGRCCDATSSAALEAPSGGTQLRVVKPIIRLCQCQAERVRAYTGMSDEWPPLADDAVLGLEAFVCMLGYFKCIL